MNGEPFLYIIQQAERDFRTPGKGYANPYPPGSDYSAAYVITTWCLYHAGYAPDSLRKTRGAAWTVSCRGMAENVVRVTDANDHRDGVTLAVQMEFFPGRAA